MVFYLRIIELIVLLIGYLLIDGISNNLQNPVATMKNLFLLLLLLPVLGHSQHKIADQILMAQQNKVVFAPFALFTSSTTTLTEPIQKALKQGTQAEIDLAQLQQIFVQKPRYISLTIPFGNSSLNLLLEKNQCLAEGFHVDTNQSKYGMVETGVHYRGIVLNQAQSVVSFSFFPTHCSGIISDGEHGNIVVTQTKNATNTSPYLIYQDVQLTSSLAFECGQSKGNFPVKAKSTNKSATQRCVTLYFEIDNNLYVENGSDITLTTQWMTAVFNNVQTLYANDGIQIALKSIYIWTTPDPYEGIGNRSSDYLMAFNQNRPAFDGDLGQLVGIDPGGLGGVAVAINGLCTDQNFSYSDVNFTYQNVPTFSWTVEVITHELGHLMGSPHTHGCYWNGNNTAIDGCGSSSGYVEGSCATGPVPDGSVGGTIMSYCHLVQGVGINLSNGFGPQPAARIQTAVNSGNCLSTDCVNTCINSVGTITTQSISPSSIQINWEDISTSSSWQISIYPISANPTIWNTTNSPAYLATNLTPNTFYNIAIIPTCANGLSPIVRTFTMVTDTNFCGGVTLTDTGGEALNYGDHEQYIRILIPSIADTSMQLTFQNFELESNYDYLYLYNGSSTEAPEFVTGGYTGTNSPGTVLSTATDGAITLRFYSDMYENKLGYVATTNCLNNLGVNPLAANLLDLQFYPNPTKGLIRFVSSINIDELTIYNMEGQKLIELLPNANNLEVSIQDLAAGTYMATIICGSNTLHVKVLRE